jgi:uncharacterized protein (DUF1499 family)
VRIRLGRAALVMSLSLVAAGLGYVRLAPSDPVVWHVDMGLPGFQPPENAQVFCLRPEGRHGPITGDPTELLARLDAVARASPRTERLAGSAAAGRITWISRSAVFGFPDFTTAQLLAGPSLCVLGRQRFGSGDLGVNAARIGGWMQALLGLPEPPVMTAF